MPSNDNQQANTLAADRWVITIDRLTSIAVCISPTGEQPMTSTNASTHQAQSRPKRGGAMMRVTIAVAALIVAIMLRPRSSSIELSAAAKPPLQELHTTERNLSLFRYFGSLSF